MTKNVQKLNKRLRAHYQGKYELMFVLLSSKRLSKHSTQ